MVDDHLVALVLGQGVGPAPESSPRRRRRGPRSRRHAPRGRRRARARRRAWRAACPSSRTRSAPSRARSARIDLDDGVTDLVAGLGLRLAGVLGACRRGRGDPARSRRRRAPRTPGPCRCRARARRAARPAAVARHGELADRRLEGRHALADLGVGVEALLEAEVDRLLEVGERVVAVGGGEELDQVGLATPGGPWLRTSFILFWTAPELSSEKLRSSSADMASARSSRTLDTTPSSPKSSSSFSSTVSATFSARSPRARCASSAIFSNSRLTKSTSAAVDSRSSTRAPISSACGDGFIGESPSSIRAATSSMSLGSVTSRPSIKTPSLTSSTLSGCSLSVCAASMG